MPTPTGGTETGVANDETGVDTQAASGSTPRKDPQLTARERALASMDAKILAQREADHAAALAEGNPIALALEAERLGVSQDDESFEARTSPRAPVAAPATRKIPEVSGMDEETEDPTPTEPMEAAPAAAKPAARKPATKPAGQDADPLASFVVMQNGKPMVRLQVDGKEELMPLERARAQLQKAGAAEARLQQATEARKQIERDRAALAAREAAVTARERTQPPATSADADPALQTEAKELVKSLMSDTPDEAASKLTKVLSRVRGAAPAVDVNAIEQRAVAAARQSIREEQVQQDIVSGFTEFQRDYPEIANDPRLFKFADNLSDEIKTEHPNWTPSQIMAEAGKQTREWLATISGGAKPTPTPKPAAAASAVSNRQLAKQNLRPMPVVRAVRREEASSQEGVPPAPADVLAEIRRSRGQAA